MKVNHGHLSEPVYSFYARVYCRQISSEWHGDKTTRGLRTARVRSAPASIQNESPKAISLPAMASIPGLQFTDDARNLVPCVRSHMRVRAKAATTKASVEAVSVLSTDPNKGRKETLKLPSFSSEFVLSSTQDVNLEKSTWKTSELVLSCLLPATVSDMKKVISFSTMMQDHAT